MFFDGFDVVFIGVAVPKMADYLHVKPGDLGVAMSAALFGMLIGSASLGMLADRVGRKVTIVLSCLAFSVLTLLCAFVTSVNQLTLLRFISGLGMGGAIPTIVAFGCEYAPVRSRATVATTLYVGAGVGAAVSGFCAMYLLPRYGWQSLFITGGAAALVISLLLAIFLPESLGLLIQRGKDKERIRRIVARINPAMAKDRETEFYSTEKKLPGVPLKHLFTEGRAVVTALLWVSFLLAYYDHYILVSWAPTLLRKSGATVTQYSLTFAIMALGTSISTIWAGRRMDKTDNPFRLLQIGFVLAFLSLVAFGLFASSPLLVVATLQLMCGIFVSGAAQWLVGIVAIFYPLNSRSTGVGYAYAVGKIGSALAPLIGGMMITLNWSVSKVCTTNAFAALIVAALMVILYRKRAAANALAKSMAGGGNKTVPYAVSPNPMG
jgi:AAHS family 4-hydroxybenzoate transporter-like MFS transporter